MDPIPDLCFQMAPTKIKSFQRCFSFLSKRNTQTVKNLNIKNRLLQTSILIWSVVLDPSWFSSSSFVHFWLDQQSIALEGMYRPTWRTRKVEVNENWRITRQVLWSSQRGYLDWDNFFSDFFQKSWDRMACVLCGAHFVSPL